MHKTIKIYHPQGMIEYSNWIPNSEPTDSIEEADLLLLEGGEDVSPLLYNQNQNPRTQASWHRDLEELGIFLTAKRLGIPILGICRGSQLSCVLAGGQLIQHQENPQYLHYINTSDNQSVIITSTHHQAQMPYNLPKEDYKVLAWTDNISTFHENGDQEESYTKDEKEVEICYYPKIKALAIQGHPEMLWREKHNYKETFDYLHDLFNKFINNEL